MILWTVGMYSFQRSVTTHTHREKRNSHDCFVRAYSQKVPLMFYVPFVYSIQVLYSSYYDPFDVHREIGKCFTELADDSDCRVIVLSGAGKMFSAGELVAFVVTCYTTLQLVVLTEDL